MTTERRSPTTAKVLAMIGVDANLSVVVQDTIAKRHSNSLDHTHSNKALLDTYTQTEANLADAVTKKHNHTTGKNDLAGNVTMTNANQFYDGASVSLAAGTWLIEAVITVQSPNTTAMRVTAKLWNGTTVEQSSEATIPSMGSGIKGVLNIKLVGIVTLAGTETWKISAAATAASFIILAAAQDNGAGNNATSIRAARIG